MVAPIDAKVVIDIDGEPVTLRLCFRSIALGIQLGVDLFSEEGIDMNLPNAALLVKSLAVVDHPEMTEDEALAVVVRHGAAEIGKVVLDLIAKFGGKADTPSTEGKVPKTRTRKPASA